MRIRSRKSWGAATPEPRTRQSPSGVRELFVHWNGESPRSFRHIDTVAEEEALMRSTQKFHMGPERGWSDFAYSFGMFPSGRVYRGRGLAYVPAAQAGHNTNTAAVIVFLGPDDKVTPEVEKAIEELYRHVDGKSAHKVKLRAHRDVTATSCPGEALTKAVRRVWRRVR
jgi:hypothetical protein